MLKKLGIAAALIGAMGGVAFAGFKTSYPVVISTTYFWAYGNMGAARNSADTSQRIGCYVWSNPGAGNTTGYCNAYDSGGHFMSCYTTDTNQIATMESASGDSYIYFTANSAGGTCALVEVMNNSEFEPKQP